MAIVLITGASRGIGADIARQLSAAGHTTFAGVRSPAKHELDDATGDLRPLVLDVTDPSQVQAAVASVVAQEGRIDALVNNAGVAWFAPAEEMSEFVLRETFETNFFGAVRCTQQVLPVFRRQRHGRIAMISTLAAVTGLPMESAYCASKSALEAFSESLRHEVGRFGIDVALFEPGVTEGGMATSPVDPHARGDSAYRALLDHTVAFYGATEPEPATLVTDAVQRFVEGGTTPFRTQLGALAKVLQELATAGPEAAEALLQEALGIAWWQAGAGEAPSSTIQGASA